MRNVCSRFGVSYSPGQLGVYDDAGPPELLVHEADDEWTDDRTHAIDDALEWIKTQLVSLRYQSIPLRKKHYPPGNHHASHL